ncbi:MAG: hypothetical protein SF053_04415 [Bacteroidia bacterium]|nr:hypothetical protein [Bacteroidia bacterium]
MMNSFWVWLLWLNTLLGNAVQIPGTPADPDAVIQVETPSAQTVVNSRRVFVRNIRTIIVVEDTHFRKDDECN